MSFFYNTFPRLRILIFFIGFIVSAPISVTGSSYCQKSYKMGQDTLKGTVIDEYGKPLSKATISGRNGTVNTGNDGQFTIATSVGDQLKISQNGFYQLTWKVKQISVVAFIRMERLFIRNADTLNVLFDKKATSSILGAVASIEGNRLMTAPTQSLLTALAGQLPGLNINQTTGYPNIDGDGRGLGLNSSFSAPIRGYSGRAALGASELIVLVDGVPRPYSSIAPEEIESVTVLKDAISTTMYGQRSTPGLLLINTKKGIPGGAKMSFSFQSAILKPLGLQKPLNAFEYANLYNQTQINSGVAPAAVKYSDAALNAYKTGSDPYLFPDVNWQETILKSSTNQNKINFNVQGSGVAIRYFVSLDYLKDNGLFNTASKNSYNTSPDYSRYSIRSNVSIDFNKTLKVDLGVFGRVEDQTQPGSGTAQSILNGINSTPALAYPVMNPNGTYGGNSTYQTNLYAQSVQSGYSLYNTKNLEFNISLTQKLDAILPGLFIKARGSVNNENQYYTFRTKSYSVVPISGALGGGYTYGTNIGTDTDIPIPVSSTTTGSALFRITNTYAEGLLGYDHQIGDHNISTKLLFNQQSSTRNEDLPYIYNTFAGNFSYNYKQKYFAEVAGSYGSFNQFADGHQYAPFYAGALGWNLAQESFFKKNLNSISNFKLRVNYGLTGYVNRNSYGYYAYIQRYTASGTYYYFSTANTATQGYAESGLANANAGGEKAKKLNIGLDLGLFKDHLSISADYFINNIYDIWVVPGAAFQTLGLSAPAQNVGKQRYKGAEFSLSYKNNLRNFHYFGSLNFSVVQSKLIYGAEAPVENSYQLLAGQPVGVFSGLTSNGLFRSQAEINSSPVPSDVDRATIRPGDIKYVDRNVDGIIDNRDVGPIGSGAPQIFYGVTLGFSYNGLDFSMLIQGIQNRQVYLSGDYEFGFRNNGLNNAYQNNLNAYSALNPNSNYPRLTIGTNVNNEKSSDFWLHDAGFARLKNAEIGFTLPGRWTSKARIPSARIFVNGENLFTISQLNDFGTKPDPEVQGASYPMQRIINFGVNIKL